MTEEQPGRVEHIHIAEVEGGPVRALASVEATAGVGLAGDRYARGEGFWPGAAGRAQGALPQESRDLTLIEAEAIDDLRVHGITLEPGESRRNITTRGVRLNELVGKEFTIGEVRARGTELCEPCTHLVALTGKPLLKPLVHRGGLRADLLTSGRIKVGDAIVPVRTADPLPTAPG
jgi:MOSC domain-containing protein YiiM